MPSEMGGAGQWEYRVVEYDPVPSGAAAGAHPAIERELNALGAAGWELVAAARRGGGSGPYDPRETLLCVLKRPRDAWPAPAG